MIVIECIITSMRKPYLTLLKQAIPERYKDSIEDQRREHNFRAFIQVVLGGFIISIALLAQYLVNPVGYTAGEQGRLYPLAYLVLASLSVLVFPVILLHSKVPTLIEKNIISIYFFLILNWAASITFLDLSNDKGFDAMVLGALIYAFLYRAVPLRLALVYLWLCVLGSLVYFNYFRFEPGFSRFLPYYIYCFAGFLASIFIERGRIENTLLRSELQDSAEELREISVRDTLTGLYNRRYLDEFLQQSIPLAKRQGHDVCFLMMDLDNFKQVNDRLGHESGDTVLKKTAEIILYSLRESDLSCRYGGEEFLVLLPNTELLEAATVAERIRNNIEKTDFGLGDLSVTISIGMSSFNQTREIKAALASADERLYQAKRSGRNCCV
ncbi:hypothetical protein MASR2M78_07700 [Treponema sp.]